MLGIEEKIQLEKEVFKTLRLLDIVTHPEKRIRLDRKLQYLFKKLQAIEDSEKRGIIPLPNNILSDANKINEES